MSGPVLPRVGLAFTPPYLTFGSTLVPFYLHLGSILEFVKKNGDRMEIGARKVLAGCYLVRENFMDSPKSRVVVGYELEESKGVLVWRS